MHLCLAFHFVLIFYISFSEFNCIFCYRKMYRGIENSMTGIRGHIYLNATIFLANAIMLIAVASTNIRYEALNVKHIENSNRNQMHFSIFLHRDKPSRLTSASHIVTDVSLLFSTLHIMLMAQLYIIALLFVMSLFMCCRSSYWIKLIRNWLADTTTTTKIE